MRRLLAHLLRQQHHHALYSFEMWFEEWRRKVLRGHMG